MHEKICFLLGKISAHSLLTAERIWFKCDLYLRFIPPINIWNIWNDLRPFLKCKEGPFSRSWRSPRSNNLEIQNDKNSIWKQTYKYQFLTLCHRGHQEVAKSLKFYKFLFRIFVVLGFKFVWPRQPQRPQEGLREFFQKLQFWNQCIPKIRHVSAFSSKFSLNLSTGVVWRKDPKVLLFSNVLKNGLRTSKTFLRMPKNV